MTWTFGCATYHFVLFLLCKPVDCKMQCPKHCRNDRGNDSAEPAQEPAEQAGKRVDLSLTWPDRNGAYRLEIIRDWEIREILRGHGILNIWNENSDCPRNCCNHSTVYYAPHSFYLKFVPCNTDVTVLVTWLGRGLPCGFGRATRDCATRD